MTNSEISNDQLKILQELINAGIIDIDEQAKILETHKRKEILKNHKYLIYQGSNGYWYTYFPDSSKKDKRRLIKRKNKFDLENEIIRFYSENLKEENKEETTLRNLYPKWLDSISDHNMAPTTARRYDCDWRGWLEKEIILRE